MTREALLAHTFVELADTLVDDFDIVDLLTTMSDRCVQILEVSAAGIMLVDQHGQLRAMASSSEVMRILELYEIQSQEGPCLDCFHTGQPVVNADLATVNGRWPRFAPLAISAGFRAADAIPMRLRDQIIGALNLFHTEPATLTEDRVTIARALADIATIAILQHRSVHETAALNDHLNEALNSRIVIEQAKGIIAEREHLDPPAAFERLRTYSRDHNRRLHDVANEIIDGALNLNVESTTH